MSLWNFRFVSILNLKKKIIIIQACITPFHCLLDSGVLLMFRSDWTVVYFLPKWFIATSIVTKITIRASSFTCTATCSTLCPVFFFYEGAPLIYYQTLLDPSVQAIWFLSWHCVYSYWRKCLSLQLPDHTD